MFTAIDPSTGQTVREVPTADPAQIEQVLAAADAARAGWQQRGFDGRAQVLREVAAQLRADSARLESLMTQEMGKPATEATGEVEKAAWCAEHYAQYTAEYLATEHIASDAADSYVQYLPLGTVLGILPWNAPVWLALRFAAPALMAGNTCIVKPDPHVPGCAAAIEEAFARAGAGEGVFSCLYAATPDIAGVIGDRRIHAVSFTGSDASGSAVASTAAAAIKPAVLELGGSDPSIVLADADLDAAADVIVRSRIINAGQSCIAAKRIIVEEQIHDEFVDLLAERLQALTVGDPRSTQTQVGPIARADLRERLHRQVTETIQAGATCVLGGRMPDGDGFFYPVTMLTEVTSSMTAAQEETFGPVMVVMRAGDEDEALAIAGDTVYGLAASIWSTRERGERLAARVPAGQVAVNGIVKTDPRLPSGGIKRSGYGRELGRHGAHEFVNAQQIWVGPART